MQIRDLPCIFWSVGGQRTEESRADMQEHANFTQKSFLAHPTFLLWGNNANHLTAVLLQTGELLKKWFLTDR